VVVLGLLALCSTYDVHLVRGGILELEPIPCSCVCSGSIKSINFPILWSDPKQRRTDMSAKHTIRDLDSCWKISVVRTLYF